MGKKEESTSSPIPGTSEFIDQMRKKAFKKAEAQSKPKKAGSFRTYKIKPGDSLSKIAKEALGDASRWPEIFELNKDQIEDPNVIRVGQEIKIPID